MNGKGIHQLMSVMGLMSIYRERNTSEQAKGHKPNQVWCVDITYLPMRRGFIYLIAIMDWHTRMVLSWRVLNTLGAQPRAIPSSKQCAA